MSGKIRYESMKVNADKPYGRRDYMKSTTHRTANIVISINAPIARGAIETVCLRKDLARGHRPLGETKDIVVVLMLLVPSSSCPGDCI